VSFIADIKDAPGTVLPSFLMLRINQMVKFSG
jgi:hypothetical protein